MPVATADGIAISYDDWGRGGSTLLFMPGWCASRQAFADIGPAAGRDGRALALDWRGHGHSGPSQSDFGVDQLVSDALAVIEASGATTIVPVATSHAGWVAIELRRRLGEQVPALVLIDWIVTEAPPPFLAALAELRNPAGWRPVLDGLFASWIEGVDHAGVRHFVSDDMGAYGFDMWSRASREIAAAYQRHGSPLAALAALEPPCPTLHLYAMPPDPAYLAAQRAFAADHTWFEVQTLAAGSHFPTIEVPGQVLDLLAPFVAKHA